MADGTEPDRIIRLGNLPCRVGLEQEHDRDPGHPDGAVMEHPLCFGASRRFRTRPRRLRDGVTPGPVVVRGDKSVRLSRAIADAAGPGAEVIMLGKQPHPTLWHCLRFTRYGRRHNPSHRTDAPGRHRRNLSLALACRAPLADIEQLTSPTYSHHLMVIMISTMPLLLRHATLRTFLIIAAVQKALRRLRRRRCHG